MSEAVYTSYSGNNSVLVNSVCRLYLNRGDKVADITFGRGVFWKQIDLSTIDFHPSDKLTCPKTPYDFCDLPYKDESFDVVVFDPPYVHNPGNLMVDSRYRNAETTKGMYHSDIFELYGKGMKEAFRILKPNGLLWVKCKDEVESSIQRWSHLELALLAWTMKMYIIDLFILTQSSRPVIQHKQNHARKNHSYLWIFKKIGENNDKLLKQIDFMKKMVFQYKIPISKV